MDDCPSKLRRQRQNHGADSEAMIVLRKLPPYIQTITGSAKLPGLGTGTGRKMSRLRHASVIEPAPCDSSVNGRPQLRSGGHTVCGHAGAEDVASNESPLRI